MSGVLVTFLTVLRTQLTEKHLEKKRFPLSCGFRGFQPLVARKVWMHRGSVGGRWGRDPESAAPHVVANRKTETLIGAGCG